MVQRNYQAPQFQTQDRRVIQEQQVAAADTRPNYERQVGDDQWRDRLFTQIAGNASQALNKMADIEFSNLYLEGQASVGIVKSEEELQGNPLTRDWKVAGYRDTMGKLALADQAATFQQDLVSLREKGPEDLQAYLTQRREKMLPALAGMSREARASAAGQLLLQDQDATKRWTSEHAKFIIEEKHQAVSTQANTMLRGVFSAQSLVRAGASDPSVLTTALRSASGFLVGSVWADNTLPKSVQQQLTFETVRNGLTQGSVELYEYLRDTPIPDQLLGGKDGPATTLLQRLDPDQQAKLGAAFVDANQKTMAARSYMELSAVALVEAQIDAGEYPGTYEGLRDSLLPLLTKGVVTGEKFQGLLNKYADGQHKQQTSYDLWGAGLRGDVQYAYMRGKGPEDIIKAGEAVMAKQGLNSEQQLQAWLQVGRNGLQEGYKKVGEYLGVSVRQMIDSKDGTVLPQHAAMFRSINASIRQAEADGLTNTRVNVLSGLGESERLFVEQVMRRVDTGAGLDESVQEAKRVQAADEALTPSAKAARASSTNTEVQKQIAAIEPRGLLETGWDKVKAVFGSSKAAFDLAATPYSGFNTTDNFFRDSPTVQYYIEQTRQAVQEEASNVLLMRPSATPDEVMSVARANVVSRTISTNNGPLIMPRNVNLEAVFGVGKGNQAAIGHAIDGLLKPTVDNTRYQLSFVQGRLFAQEFDKDGERVGTGNFIAADQIKAKIAEDVAKETKAADERFGRGKTVEADGVKVVYNGTNRAGVQNDWMLGFRDNLVQNEGVRSKVYKDTVGRETVGVGIAKGNPHYPAVGPDGAVNPDQVGSSFRMASDDAARAGIQIARKVNVDNKAGFMLMAELAYQSGTSFAFQKNTTGDQYRAFIRAVNDGDLTSAQEKFKETAAYRVSGETRQKHYLSLLEQAMYNPRRASGVVTPN